MNILRTIFKDLSTFTRYAPGVETNMSLDDLQASGLTARKRVESIITAKVFSAILKEPDDAPLLDALRSGMANITMATQLIFDSISRRKNNVDVYKYELEAMKRSYMENYSNAMSTIVQLLTDKEPTKDETDTPVALWRTSRYYRLIESCRIKSADEFDTIYPIDLSYLFFFRLIPLQKETLDERLSVYYDKLTSDNRAHLEPELQLALAKKTIAKALRRFDVLEFPPTIRNLFDDNKASRQGATEHDALIKLADRLDDEAETLIKNMDALLSTDTTPDVSSFSAYNHPDDKIIMFP